jgi:hypothetical protein
MNLSILPIRLAKTREKIAELKDRPVDQQIEEIMALPDWAISKKEVNAILEFLGCNKRKGSMLGMQGKAAFQQSYDFWFEAGRNLDDLRNIHKINLPVLGRDCVALLLALSL